MEEINPKEFFVPRISPSRLRTAPGQAPEQAELVQRLRGQENTTHGPGLPAWVSPGRTQTSPIPEERSWSLAALTIVNPCWKEQFVLHSEVTKFLPHGRFSSSWSDLCDLPGQNTFPVSQGCNNVTLAIFSCSGHPKAELPKDTGEFTQVLTPNQPRAPLLQPHIKGDLGCTPIPSGRRVSGVFCW